MVIIQMFSSAREADLPAMTWRCPFLSLLFVHMFQLPFSLLLCLIPDSFVHSFIQFRLSASSKRGFLEADHGHPLQLLLTDLGFFTPSCLPSSGWTLVCQCQIRRSEWGTTLTMWSDERSPAGAAGAAAACALLLLKGVVWEQPKTQTHADRKLWSPDQEGERLALADHGLVNG